MLRIKFRAMACDIEALIESDSDSARDLLENVPAWFEDWENKFSRFLPASELNWINNSAGKEIQVSSEFWDVLQIALKAEKESEGLVSPAILPALEYAGYTQNFDPYTPFELDLNQPSTFTSYSMKEIRQDRENHVISLPFGMKLDLGGFVKGWAANETILRLSTVAPSLVNAGGDIACNNRRNSTDRWSINILDPLNSDSFLTTLTLQSGGIATSGTDYRRWLQGGELRHHIIDPRTNLPSDSDVIAATIVAGDAVSAEWAAKTVLILGSKKGLKLLEDHPDAAGLIVLEDESVLVSSRLHEFIWDSDFTR